MLKPRYEDEEEMYLPEISDDDSDFANVHDGVPHSNAGVALGWSALEQQMFDLLLLNRFNNGDSELLDDVAKTISDLLKTYKSYDLARLMSVVMLANQLSATENKSFAEEYEKYCEYIKKHPEDIEEL
ncbi:MAG: hypothetical protein K6G55_03435 [Selenomonadaceae bacterium]|nr:hypothetical protein [Selenomonadaceae bacterium]